MFEDLKKKREEKEKARQKEKQRKAEEKKQKKQKAEAEKQKKKQENAKIKEHFWEKYMPMASGNIGGQTVKPGSQDLNVKGKPTAGKPKTGIPDPFDLISKTITYGAEKLEADGKNFYEGIKRGASQVGGALMSDYKTASDPVLDCLEYLLELRKQDLERDPLNAHREEQTQAFYASVKKGFVEGADWVGNKAYEADIPIVSDFLGGLLDASSMEDNGSPAAVTGSLVNGGGAINTEYGGWIGLYIHRSCRSIRRGHQDSEGS